MLEEMKNKAYQLLRWSEKYTKTDMVYLLKGGSWLSVSHFIAMASTFILAVAFANLVPKSSYGTYKYILSIASIVGAVTYSGISSAIVQSVARGKFGAFAAGARVHAKWNIIAVSIAFITSGYYFLAGNLTLAFGILLAGSLAPFISTFSLYGQYLVGIKDFRKKTLYGVFHSLIPTVLLIISTFFTEDPLVFVSVFYISTLVTVASLFFLTLKSLEKYDKSENYTETKKYGAHLSAINIIGAFSFQIDKILMFHFLGAAQLAIYSIALAAPQQLRQVSKTLSALILPKASSRPLHDLQKTLPKKALYVFLGACVLSGAYILAAPIIFKIFFNPYLESVWYSQAYALVIVILPIILFKESLVAHSKTKELYTIQIIVPLSKVLLLLWLLPAYGIGGAILALLATEIINFLVTYFLFKKAK